MLLLIVIGFLVWYFVLREDDAADVEETTELLLPFLALGPKGMFEVARIRPRR